MLTLKLTKIDTEKAKLQNPSRVRDHLANERTYLAWMRTAIALMGFGVAIVRLRILYQFSKLMLQSWGGFINVIFGWQI
ncbi:MULTISPECIES: YidH family protein [Kamptonema]|uniref:YidH family protein n=1 Tax=Kamptonema TaxID=1501433 RepID=UPI0001DAC67D|nr:MULTISPECIES: DUF202 domain-containing protein [Kamptonema]CBN54906.1 hypothetical protein OSCI_1150006 [Kamptonema sp. PCC 6506]